MFEKCKYPNQLIFYIYIQIEQLSSSSKFEDEIRQEQEEKRKQAEEAAERKRAFKDKANMWK